MSAKSEMMGMTTVFNASGVDKEDFVKYTEANPATYRVRQRQWQRQRQKTEANPAIYWVIQIQRKRQDNNKYKDNYKYKDENRGRQGGVCQIHKGKPGHLYRFYLSFIKSFIFHPDPLLNLMFSSYKTNLNDQNSRTGLELGTRRQQGRRTT